MRVYWFRTIQEPTKTPRLAHFSNAVVRELDTENYIYTAQRLVTPLPPNNHPIKLKYRRFGFLDRVPGLRRFGLIFSAGTQVPLDLLRNRYDLCFTYMLGSFSTVAVVLFGHLIRRKPYVVMCEHWYPRSGRLRNWWYRFVAHRAELVVAQSTRSQRFFCEHMGVPEEQVVRCVNTLAPLHALPYNTGLEAELTSDDVFRILCVARFERFKGQDVLIRAVRATDLDLEVVFVGEHETPYGAECIAQADGDPRFNFVGKVPYEDVLAYYRGCQVFALPNVFTDDPVEGAESFGYAPMEAGYFGLPLVLTEATGAGLDLIVQGVTGFEVSSRSEVELAGRLRAFTQNEALRRSCSVAVRRHVQRICSDDTIAEFRNRFEAVIHRHSAA